MDAPILEHASNDKHVTTEPAKDYISRAFLSVPNANPGNGPKISVMTYNTLAQALVNRKRYPTSGTALRWANRSKVIFEEITDYSPDILCLQEVDTSTWDREWAPKLKQLGYQATFHASRQKKHGIAIAYKFSKFTCSLHMLNTRTLFGVNLHFYTILAGDFNSQPFDAAYLSITEKPSKIKSHLFILCGYGLIHPENSGLDNKRNEPLFSNWTDTWKGLIDYICVVSDWDNTNNRKVDSLDDFTRASSMRLLRLLKMPSTADMGPEQFGLPQPGMYPSDHLCMMAELELL
ncbi:hypothetical protein HF325_004951 [Metschnikowia pulcherrima]|uniref:Endonuclease/exonuclease/phosphatase domain-containing protein n=1 Tax=Metschnikowia pulcherrima TaxID=27326 RepID=A0A8H7GRE2_9ASCO|nr:hypothetical protein HF325_004951 [Metschnikowia pulcherrima]